MPTAPHEPMRALPDRRPSAGLLRPGQHLPGLDALRGVAILAVVLFHFHQLTSFLAHPTSVADRILVQGWFGVDLFFALSGFLITGILLDAKGDAPSVGDGYFRSFWVRRAVRIFPLYYVALVVAALTGSIPAGASGWWHAVYLTNVVVATKGWGAVGEVGHFWSLAVEEQFYLVWPLVVALSSRRGLLRICLGTLVASFALRIAIYAATSRIGHPGAGPVIAYVFTGTRLDTLALGAFLALVLRDAALLARWRRIEPWAVAASAIAVLALVIRFPGGFQTTVAGQVIGFPALALLAISAIRHAVSGPSATTAWWHRALSWLGRYSYGIYVWHHLLRRPILTAWTAQVGEAAFTATWWGRPAFLLLGVVVSLAVARLSWAIWEQPWLRLKRYFPMPTYTAPTASAPRAAA